MDVKTIMCAMISKPCAKQLTKNNTAFSMHLSLDAVANTGAFLFVCMQGVVLLLCG